MPHGPALSWIRAVDDAKSIVAIASRRVGRFLAWWGRELLACLPVRVRELIVPPQSQLVIEILKEGALRFSELTPEGKETLTTVRPRGPNVEEMESLKGFAAAADGIVVSLPESCGVRRRIELPAAARENLREVVAMEMDRLTPFKSNEVYFQIGKMELGRTKDLIALDLTVVPRSLADDVIQLARSLGVDPDTVALGDPALDGTNLVALDASVPLRTPRLLSRGFALAGTLLIAAIIAVPFIKQAHATAGLRSIVASAGTKGTGSSAQQKFAALSEGVQRLDILRREEPFTVAVLDELAHALPAGTWLSEIEIGRTKLSLTGFSDNAASLLGVLEQLEHLQAVKFDEAVVFDERQGKDRFRLSASVVASRAVPAR